MSKSLSGILRLPPIVVTVALVLTFAAPMIFMNPSGELSENLLPIAVGGALGIELYTIWEVALYTTAAPEPSPAMLVLLVVVAALGLVHPLLAYEMQIGDALGRWDGPIVGLLVLLSLATALLTANVLADAERPPPSSGKRILLFAAIFYLPLGIWFIDARVKRLAGGRKS